MEESFDTFGELLRCLRRRAQLTQRDLGAGAAAGRSAAADLLWVLV